ncbi:DNA-binding domain-containing protein [Rickettsiella endosymbiont of Dermanyssus gallinae]|uniref:HvfC/BufC N-terminal domain-containing protein n=1 Tax=Rickettsiella endosymbiont of Dermanyssus gallinae TaxID=2856608 RepID=UPI001C5282EA|nr:DNA-binding domain-containing protein [Rickettsiella endosymbiont of Dermanyssus gallinae]
MSSLASLQAALQRHLLEDDEQIANELVLPRQGELAERLAVYADGYRWRLIDALQKEYASLHHYLGDDAFTELSEVYLDEYPSRFYSISDFTKQLPQFLLQHQPQQGYLSELAQIISALSLSLEAADAQFLDPTALAKMPLQNWPSLCFKYHPSVHYFSFQWNTFSLWKALVQKTAFPTPTSQNSYCIVWRKELQSYANSLTEPEAVVFAAFSAGSCFADVCELVCARGLVGETEAAALLANCLTRWLNDHLISEVYIP